MAVRGSLTGRSCVVFYGGYESSNAQLFAKVGNLLIFGFEIPVIEVPKDKIQTRQLRAHVLDGVFASVAEVFPANSPIHEAREQVIDAAVSEEHSSRCMTFP